MHTAIRAANRQSRKTHELAIAHWLTALVTGLIFTASAVAASITSSDPATPPSPNIYASKPSLRIAIAEALQEPLKGDISTLRQAFNYAGYHLELVPLPAQRGLRKAAAGELDGELLRRREDITAFPTLLAIEEPLRHVALWIWMRADKQCPSSPQELHKYTMATVLSYGFVKKIPLNAGARKFQTNSVISSLLVLQAGRVDFVMFDKSGMAYYQDRLDLDVKSCFEDPISSTDYFSFMHSKHRDKLPALTAALRRVKLEQALND